jgi:hypothetical protein
MCNLLNSGSRAGAWVLWSILVFAFQGQIASLAQGADERQGLYVFASDGRYVIFDQPSFKVVRIGNIWSDFASARLTSGERLASGWSISEVITDSPDDRVYILYGNPRVGEFMGFLVFQMPKFEPIGIIHQLMTIGPVKLLPVKEGQIYLTYLKTSKAGADNIETETAIYDAQTFKRLPNQMGQSLRLNTASCVLDNGALLYSRDSIFDASSAKELRDGRFRGKPYLTVDCGGGRALLLSESPNKRIVLTIYDPKTDRVVSEIATDSEFRVNWPEWRLSKNGQLVIQDEQKLVAVGSGQSLIRTGRLVLYDVQSGTKNGEIQLPVEGADSGIVDQSRDGWHVFYRSADKLYVVDLRTKMIMRELKLGFSAVGVFGP